MKDMAELKRPRIWNAVTVLLIWIALSLSLLSKENAQVLNRPYPQNPSSTDSPPRMVPILMLVSGRQKYIYAVAGFRLVDRKSGFSMTV